MAKKKQVSQKSSQEELADQAATASAVIPETAPAHRGVGGGSPGGGRPAEGYDDRDADPKLPR